MMGYPGRRKPSKEAETGSGMSSGKCNMYPPSPPLPTHTHKHAPSRCRGH